MLSSAAFDNIDGSASEVSTRDWAQQEEHAKRERIRDVTAMDIYDIKMKRRESNYSTLLSPSLDNRFQSLLGHKYFRN